MADNSQREPGLVQSVRRLAALVAETLRTRLELALLEGRELGLRFLIYLVLVLLAAVLLLTGWFMANVLLVAIFRDHAVVTAFTLVVLNVLGGALLLFLAWHRYRADGPFFEATLAELKRDRQLLGGTADAADRDTP